MIDSAQIQKVQDNFDAASDMAFKYISGFRQLPAGYIFRRFSINMPRDQRFPVATLKNE